MLNLKETREKVDAALLELQVVKKRYKDDRHQLIEEDSKLASAEIAQELIQKAALAIQEEAHQRIASIVSRCLETVFDDPYEFKIIFERKRNRTEARPVFVRDGHEIDPISSGGGGVIDVASFALRLACVVLKRPRIRKVLILDEPFRFVSQEYRGRVRDLLLSLSEDLGVQIVMVTHIEELKIGKVVQL